MMMFACFLSVNTHCHADHITGTGLLKKNVFGLKSAISKHSGAAADIQLSEGDRITFGKHVLKTSHKRIQKPIMLFSAVDRRWLGIVVYQSEWDVKCRWSYHYLVITLTFDLFSIWRCWRLLDTQTVVWRMLLKITVWPSPVTLCSSEAADGLTFNKVQHWIITLHFISLSLNLSLYLYCTLWYSLYIVTR